MMEDEAFSRYERRVRELAAFGHRGSATEQERRAARYLAGELRGLGFASEEERFRGSRSLGMRLLVHVGVAAVGAMLLCRRPRAGAALGALALGSLICEQRTRGSLLSWPFTRAASFNVAARLPVRSSPPNGRVIVCGHYDTQRTGLLWSDPMSRLAPLLSRSPLPFQSPFFPLTAAMGAQCLIGALPSFGVGRAVVSRLAGLIGLVYAIAAVLLAEWAAGADVPGASDNASGAAAVLSLGEQWLANPVARVEVVLLFTGSEEVGMLGAAAWADRHRAEIRSLPTRFLNLDGLGFGAPRFLSREMPIAGLPVPYPAPVLRLCRQVALELGLVNAGPHTTFGPTDGLAFLARGLSGITVIGSGEQGQLPNYHQLTDIPERMDFRVAWGGVQFAGRLLRQLAAVAAMPSGPVESFSIIVPAFNEEAHLGRTLERIHRTIDRLHQRTGVSAELLVVDNASTDNTAGVASAVGATVLHEPIRNIARARNTGVRAATGEVLVFVDADTL